MFCGQLTDEKSTLQVFNDIILTVKRPLIENSNFHEIFSQNLTLAAWMHNNIQNGSFYITALLLNGMHEHIVEEATTKGNKELLEILKTLEPYVTSLTRQEDEIYLVEQGLGSCGGRGGIEYDAIFLPQETDAGEGGGVIVVGLDVDADEIAAGVGEGLDVVARVV